MNHRKGASSQVKKAPSFLAEFLYLLMKVVLLIGVVWGLFTFVFGVARYLEPGMRPAVKEGDVVLYDRLTKVYQSQDVVVLRYKGDLQLRRVVATTGDVVEITEDGLIVNGALQQEPMICEPTIRYQEGIEFPVTVPEEAVFVLGDSRRTATDSRIYGPVAIEDTLGKVISLFRRRGI